MRRMEHSELSWAEPTH